MFLAIFASLTDYLVDALGLTNICICDLLQLLFLGQNLITKCFLDLRNPPKHLAADRQTIDASPSVGNLRSVMCGRLTTLLSSKEFFHVKLTTFHVCTKTFSLLFLPALGWELFYLGGHALKKQ